jgi:mono/diheme cytochrome c family protein
MTLSKAIGGLIVVIAVVGIGVLVYFGTRPGSMSFVDKKTVSLDAYPGKPTGVPMDFQENDALAHGRYLTQAADCVACHTVEGGKPFTGGRPFKTQFGVLYAPNITPDSETGIGSYSDEEFIKAMHEGVGRGGKKLYPAFPYTSYTYLTNEDILAIKAYLFSLPPVKSTSPPNDLAFPFNQRALMSIWAALFNENERFKPSPEESAEWNRGAYVVEALGHCGECHTPRNLMQALDNGKKFAGAVTVGWKAYNITNDPASGVGGWTDEQLVSYLSTGHAEGRGSATGPMGEALDYSLRHLSPSDVHSMVTYLRTVPGIKTGDAPPKAAGPAPAAHKQMLASAQNYDVLGKRIFQGACVSCHDWNGAGSLTSYATVTGSRSINDPSAVNVAQVVMQGEERVGNNGTVFMPSFGHAYSDTEIAAVANYVTARFGGKASDLTAARVAELRQQAN